MKLLKPTTSAATVALLGLSTVDGCSVMVDKKEGLRARDGFARPLKDSSDLVVLTLDYFPPESTSLWEPNASFQVIVDMETGSMENASPDSFELQEKPTALLNPTGDFRLIVNSNTTPPMASITGPKNAVSFRVDELTDGSTPDLEELQQHHLDREYNSLLFYSPILDLVYVLYSHARIRNKVLVKTFSLDSEGNLVAEKFFEAEGVPYLAPGDWQIYEHNTGHVEIYDDVQVLKLPGFGSDCIHWFYAHYNSSSVAHISTSHVGHHMDLVDAMDSSKGTFYEVTNQWIRTPMEPCPRDTYENYGLFSCQVLSAPEISIMEYAINNANGGGWGPNPNSTIRQVALSSEELEESVGLLSGSAAVSLSVTNVWLLPFLGVVFLGMW